jgi:hypothetical protein
MEGEAAERHGAIGCLRAEFGTDKMRFMTAWTDNQYHLKTPAFKSEFDEVINSLRNDGDKPPFASRANLADFCRENYKNGTAKHGGYTIQTADYSYYFHLLPQPGDYDIYCFAYDNRYLLPELAGKHDLPKICFSTLPSTGELILIWRNGREYTPSSNSTGNRGINRFNADSQNSLRDITRAQEEAMLAGLIFGWDKPAAKPWNYDMDGNLRHILPKKKDTPER